jgi:hypothetical protein
MQNCSIQQESGTGPALSFAGRRTRNVGRCVFLALLLLLPRCADAHLVTTGAGPFYDGIAHFS